MDDKKKKETMVLKRINVDLIFFTDKRVNRLASFCKESHLTAMGRLLQIWMECYLGVSDVLSEEKIEMQSEWAGEKTFSELLVLAKLADKLDAKTYRIKGVGKRIREFRDNIERQREKGKKSAEARREKYGTAIPHGGVNDSNHGSTEIEPRLKSDRTETEPTRTDSNPFSYSFSDSFSDSFSLSDNAQKKEKKKGESERVGAGESGKPSTGAGKPSPRGAIDALASDDVCQDVLITVTQSAQVAWLRAYPDAAWLGMEIRKAYAWIESNPQKRPKNLTRFLANWFSRAYESHRKGIPSTMTNSDRNANRLKEMHEKVQKGDL